MLSSLWALVQSLKPGPVPMSITAGTENLPVQLLPQWRFTGWHQALLFPFDR